jgi:hypothetical protein
MWKRKKEIDFGEDDEGVSVGVKLLIFEERRIRTYDEFAFNRFTVCRLNHSAISSSL